MGTKGREIVGLEVDKLVKMLNKALADEWLAYYQYWIGAQIVTGPMREAVQAELTQHATEELGHAALLVPRIIQLGGTPLLDPQQWFKETNCGYDAPDDPTVHKVLDQNIKGEQCAISVYKKLADMTALKDPVTYQMVVGILRDEVEHEEDLQAIVEDLKVMAKKSP